MDKNLLINMHRAMVFMRADIKREDNLHLLSLLCECIEKPNSDFFEKCQKSELPWLVEISSDNFLQADGEKSDIAWFKEFFVSICKRIIFSLEECDYRLAYKLCDGIHFIPELISEDKEISEEEAMRIICDIGSIKKSG